MIDNKISGVRVPESNPTPDTWKTDLDSAFSEWER